MPQMSSKPGSSALGVSLHEYDKEVVGDGDLSQNDAVVQAPLDWAPYYLEFDGLMRRLQRVGKEFGMRKAVSSRSLTGETRTLAEILDKEVEKIVLFYLRIQGEVAHRIWNLREKQGNILHGDNVVTMQALDLLSQQYRDIGYDVLELLEYLEYNVTGLRRITKRYDNHFDIKMSRLYFDPRLSGEDRKHSQLLQLYHQEGLRAIIATLRNAFQDINDARLDLTLLKAWADEVKRQKRQASPSAAAGASGRGSATGTSGGGYGSIKQPGIPVFPAFEDVKDNADIDAEAGSLLRSSVVGDGGADNASANESFSSQFAQPAQFPSPTSRASSVQTPIPKTSYLSRLTASLSVPQLVGLEMELEEEREGQGQELKDEISISGEQQPARPMLTPLTAASEKNDDIGTGDGAGSGSDSNIFTTGAALFFSTPIKSLLSTFRSAQPTSPAPATCGIPVRRTLSDLEPILKKITETEERVMRSQARTTSEYLASHSEMALEQRRAAEDEESDDETGYKVIKRKTSKAGLFLNLLVTFLFMANAYIVGPTSGQYAIQLGESKSNGALIIGLSPVAALLSTIMYSYWTNFAFKTPLVVSVAVSVVGNLLYGAALQCESGTMLFAGRLMCGIGAPRVIARRYIADHVALKHVTLASSHFITAGALGLAFGPLVSSIVTSADIDTHVRIFDYDLVHFTNVTAPGWIMFLLWGAALIGILLSFEEPARIVTSSSGGGSSSRPQGGKAVQDTSCYQAAVDSFQWIYGFIYNTLCCFKPCQTVSGTGSTQYTDLDALEATSPTGNDLLDVEIGEVEMNDMHAHEVKTGLLDHIHEHGFRRRSVSSDSNSFSFAAGAPTFDNGFEEGLSDNMSTKYVSTSSASGLNNRGKSDSMVSNSGILDKNNSLNVLNRMRDMSMHMSSLFFDLSAEQQLRGEESNSCNKYCCSWLWKVFNFEVTVILAIYFVNKVGQEMIVSSIPDLSSDLFQWDMNQAGFFMAAMGALVLPANILIATFREAEDRRLMLPLFILECIAIFFLLNFGFFDYTSFQYMLGATLLFSLLNAQEGIMMSILSKVTPGESSLKTFTNSGFLATELGILGRVVADVGITVVMSEYGSGGEVPGVVPANPNFISNVLFVFLGVLTISSTVAFYVCYDYFGDK